MRSSFISSMWLPTPSPAAVEEFRVLYERQFSVTLSDIDAQRLASQTLTLVYVLDLYSLLPVRQEEH